VKDDWVESFDSGAGQRRVMELFNPILQRCDPPLEIIEHGEIVAAVEQPFRRLVEQPLPNSAPMHNTDNLGSQGGDGFAGRLGWLWPVAVLGAFDAPVAHLAFDDSGVGA
jgi:hypothetical protein